MDIETIRVLAEVVGIPVFGVLGWALKKAIDDLRELEKAMSEYKLHVAENYVTKNSLEKVIETFTRSNEAIMRQLERMDDKLDSKADRVHA
ncbi:MAG: hypothetical protein V4463_05160 [Pseudomonadota bacterium]